MVREGIVMPEFRIHSEYKEQGDQPEAIRLLVEGLKKGHREQTLLGVTGSGKTFTMARIIEEVQRPSLVMAPNKTLAGQLYSEFKQFFPENAVEYFISYYDYYQPEAYVPQTDTYIEKDSSINDEIDNCATQPRRLFGTARCYYRSQCFLYLRTGAPEDYYAMALSLPQMEISR